MRFDLNKSELLYEVRYENPVYDDVYTYEFLYKDYKGRCFMHFIGSKYSEYAVKIGYDVSIGREGNYFISQDQIDKWKKDSNGLKECYPDMVTIFDWEKKYKEDLLWMEKVAGEELPF